jgi:hypothetical protein
MITKGGYEEIARVIEQAFQYSFEIPNYERALVMAKFCQRKFGDPAKTHEGGQFRFDDTGRWAYTIHRTGGDWVEEKIVFYFNGHTDAVMFRMML